MSLRKVYVRASAAEEAAARSRSFELEDEDAPYAAYMSLRIVATADGRLESVVDPRERGAVPGGGLPVAVEGEELGCVHTEARA